MEIEVRTALVVLASFLAVGCPRRTEPAPAIDAAPPAPAASSSAASSSASSSASSEPPDVTTEASATWDAGAAVVTSGAVDGDALRRRSHARLASDRSPVTVLQGGSARELGARICKASVPKRPKDTPILIKPNLGGFESFKDPATSGGDDGLHGRTTDVEFVRGIVQCLKERGHTQITIGEGFAYTHREWDKLLRVNGYGAMAKEEGVKIVGFDDDGVFDVEGDQPGKPLTIRGMEKTHAPNLLMAKVLAEHLERGLFISAPKIKQHRYSVTSMAIKGGQGVVMLSDASPAFNQKWRMHKELSDALKLLGKDKEAGQKAYLDSLHVFAERMADVLEVATPDVVLAEGAPAMGGDGFRKLWPSAENVAIGGTNPILVDRVGAQMLGVWDNADLARELGGHKTSPLIEIAAKRFGVDLANVTITGDGAELLSKKRPVHYVSMSGFSLLSDDRPPQAVPGRDDGAAKPELHAKAIEGLAIDGVIEPAWNEAPAITFDTDWSGKKTAVTTKVRAARSKDALYMLWELEGAGLNVDEARPVKTERDKLYEEDCVEVFFTPDPADKAKYYEVEVGPLGHFFDIDVNKKKSDTAWSSEPEIATKVDRAGKRVTIEMALKATGITSALKPGARLPLGLYRMEGKAPRSYLAWSPTRTEKPNFHVPDAFGLLVVE